MNDSPLPVFNYNFGSEFSEVAYVFKTIREQLTKDEELVIMSYHSTVVYDVFSDLSIAHHVRNIPIRFHLPEQMMTTANMAKVEFAPCIDGDSRSDRRNLGLTEWNIRTLNGTITAWKWRGILDVYPIGNSVVILRKKDLKTFYRLLLSYRRGRELEITPPVLPQGVLNEIYINTIGFLSRAKGRRDLYKKHNIPYKRGILLAGNPGCGKTMTLKWLRRMCQVEGLETRVVTLEDYKNAASRGNVASLFRLPPKKCGLLFFDDMDVMVKDRKTGLSDGPLQTFLTNLDGINTTDGTVFVFTTNVIKELDEAFVRPGRIDLFITFRPPSKQMRKRFISERFCKELLEDIDEVSIADRTKGYTFAELEEIRKLLTIDLIDGKPISADRTFKIFELHRKEFQDRVLQGFGQIKEDEEIYDDLAFEAHSYPPPAPYGI